MPPEKKWRIVYPGTRNVDEFTSLVKTYAFVEALRNAWAAGQHDATGTLTVQTDRRQGAGWEPYDHIDFAAEGEHV
ncbi:hypothetical protein AB0F72_08585 [Actinoplanes sp. NPDC023936]|uniref:hypothetical protein n=1 Tax=Actinoplanes sp. NPDC023936 TaxID=3154910 RepID=UPI0033E1AA8E